MSIYRDVELFELFLFSISDFCKDPVVRSLMANDYYLELLDGNDSKVSLRCVVRKWLSGDYGEVKDMIDSMASEQNLVRNDDTLTGSGEA